jgi:hypothetical protein
VNQWWAFWTSIRNGSGGSSDQLSLMLRVPFAHEGITASTIAVMATAHTTPNIIRFPDSFCWEAVSSKWNGSLIMKLV